MITLKDIEDGEFLSGKIHKAKWYAHHCRMGTATTCWCKCVGTSDDPKHELMDSIIPGGATDQKTAEYIAHHNPAFMLELYEHIRAMREALEELVDLVDNRHEVSLDSFSTQPAREALGRIK